MAKEERREKRDEKPFEKSADKPTEKPAAAVEETAAPATVEEGDK
jgi:small subunit ribosomal protein S6